MSSQEISLKLLNRTKYAQNRTKYYTVGNTVLAQTERPLFITGSFNDCVGNLKSLSLRKSYLNRHSSKRGPFQKLSFPHEYFKFLGDPAYYSHSELLYACSYSSENFMCDSYFWKQICEKLREVRDVVDIKDLLSCLCSVVKVNYYDRDLLRMLSREFVDDIDKLSLAQIHQLLHCYFKQNVYSCDLIDKVGLKITQHISTAQTSEHSDKEINTNVSFLDKIKDLIPGKAVDVAQKCEFDLKTLSRICKYLSYFNYANSNFYSAISNLFILYCNHMDFTSRLHFFNSINPKLINSPESTNLNDLLTKFLQSFNNDSIIYHENVFDHENVYDHENVFELGTFLSSELFKNAENSKLLHNLCSIASTINLISNSISHLHHFNQSEIVNKILNSSDTATGLAKLFDKLYQYCDDIIDVMYKITPLNTNGKSPFIQSLENIFMDSILTSVKALNSFYRLQVIQLSIINSNNSLLNTGNSIINSENSLLNTENSLLNTENSVLNPENSVLNPENSVLNPENSVLNYDNTLHNYEQSKRMICRVLKFTTEDDTIHAYFLKNCSKINVTSSDVSFISKVSQCLEDFNCKSQSTSNLTSAFELFSLLPLIKSELREACGKGVEILSLEIIRQLVDFNRQDIYRIKLLLNFTNTNSLLNHYISYFPKITRRQHLKHHYQ
ncbi:hypothetical protein TpMuguga_01g01233 [Theileria parva strain Muguga]|uniref:uncharacterized protein n=1 Tax=Theileria parva strain Muguga TaxID=333668 RepID=UPI001C6245A2|nr:uncharacterized protein TpMuguga_01g01233 [Theileria parva strain Muguga]EAN33691.2 hypothetical protein TpMuguga_01g01233 [Theileria parva strain Muguga]